MCALTDLKNARARQEGYDAYHAQLPRHAPERFGVFSGKWVEGWEAAAFGDPNRIPVQYVKYAKTVPTQSDLNTVNTNAPAA